MSQKVELNVETRQTGKSTSRALRNKRMIPAVIYGSIEPKNIAIDESSILKYNTSAYENALFTVKSKDNGLSNIVALMKEVVVNPLTRRPVHVDLLALDLKKAVRVSVEVKLEGKPAGLADGGLLSVITRQVEIECLPNDIPEFLTADVSSLGVGDALHVSDLKIPTTLKMISAAELTVAVVNVLAEESAAPVAAAAPAAAAPAAKKEDKK